MVTINIGRKEMVFFSVVILVFVVAGLVIAYGGSEPAVMGHSAEEINGVCLSDGTNCDVNKAYVDGAATVAFGTWTTKDSAGNTIVRRVKYKAPSDGFVFGKDGADGHLQIYIYAADCSTVLVSYYGNQHGAGHVGSLPIPKDTCFEFDPTSADTDVIYWLPVGGNERPIKQ